MRQALRKRPWLHILMDPNRFICEKRIRVPQQYAPKKEKRGPGIIAQPSSVSIGSPNGTRTRVFGVRGRYPRPLDDGTAIPSYMLLVISYKLTVVGERYSELCFTIERCAE